MQPKQNDVLSGRGACFNQHPGNKRFRRIIDEHKDAYTAGTKKQKMVLSHAIVDAIYSMEPPGRFLKKGDNNAEWRELSKKEASNKAAQAMAYAVRNEFKPKPKMPSTSSPSADDQPVPLTHVNIPSVGNSSLGANASAASRQGEGTTTAADDGGDTDPGGDDDELFLHDNSSRLQQQPPLQIQHPTSIHFPSNSNSGEVAHLTGNELPPLTRTQLLSQEQIQRQQYHLQQQLHHQHLRLPMGQHALQPQTQLPSASLPSTSLPSTQSLSAPGAILPNIIDTLRQEYLLRGSYGTQPSSLLQNQGNVQPNPNAFHSVVGNYLHNQSIFGTAQQQQEAQLLDQLQRALQNHLLLSSSSSLAASNHHTQLQPLDLLQQIALLQQNSQQYAPPNNSADVFELSGDDIAPQSGREGQGGDGRRGA